ncbi:MAG: PEP-CTERM sorting domain-containing protein [Nostoc sp. ChiQUE01a]|nr:PEP-CTERM sorting domain-containing protein [Nostoc sp. ChiQUE01a]
MHLLLRTLIVGLLISGMPSVARAALITFTHEGSGSGSLNGISFNNTNFTIIGTGDTSNRESFGQGFSIANDSASIEINGVGNFMFTTPTRVFVNNFNSTVGFSRAGTTTGEDLYNGPSNSVFNSWDMLSSIGPISGSTKLLQWSLVSLSINTDSGILIFNDEFTTGVFTATIASVPEPQTILGAATALLFGSALKRKRSKSHHNRIGNLSGSTSFYN